MVEDPHLQEGRNDTNLIRFSSTCTRDADQLEVVHTWIGTEVSQLSVHMEV
jgi:hypothetical protein